MQALMKSTMFIIEYMQITTTRPYEATSLNLLDSLQSVMKNKK